MELVCLRHAESENVVAGASGALPYAALTARGREQARALAGTLSGVARAYASTAVRARETAELLDDRVVQLPELAEIGLGAAEGQVDPALRRETADVLRAWVVDGELDRRVADGETGHAVLARMTIALDRIADRHPGERVAVVGHVGSLTLAVAVRCGLGGSVWGRPLPPAVPFRVTGGGTRWHCPRWPA